MTQGPSKPKMFTIWLTAGTVHWLLLYNITEAARSHDPSGSIYKPTATPGQQQGRKVDLSSATARTKFYQHLNGLDKDLLHPAENPILAKALLSVCRDSEQRTLIYGNLWCRNRKQWMHVTHLTSIYNILANKLNKVSQNFLPNCLKWVWHSMYCKEREGLCVWYFNYFSVYEKNFKLIWLL